MNRDILRLEPYPFERLRQHTENITPNSTLKAINFGIGEPKHNTPHFVSEVLHDNWTNLSQYPSTNGQLQLRQGIAQWLATRYDLDQIDPDRHVLPVNGSREALFAITQTVINRSSEALVLCPNPFYQIYEGAAFLAGATPIFLNCLEPSFLPDYSSITPDTWKNIQLVFVCSPNNPSGTVTPLSQWAELFALSDQYNFVIASDECYSEIYFEGEDPPIGALQAAKILGHNFDNLLIFNSLSKRSNLPGLRSGFVAGDPKWIQTFLKYRTYHGSAMSPLTQAVSLAAWQDEEHVIKNRQLYTQKFAAVLPILNAAGVNANKPDASFYLWIKSPLNETDIVTACELFKRYNVTVLPGSFLSRTSNDINPGSGYVRIALVAPLDECIEGANRIAHYYSTK